MLAPKNNAAPRHNKRTPMKPSDNCTLLRPALALLTLLAASCSPVLQPSPTLPADPAIPPLSPLARQPAIPSFCLPTCLDALTKERESWRSTLTPRELQDKPANATTTR